MVTRSNNLSTSEVAIETFNLNLKSVSGLILQSTDRRTVPFLDILIECELKQVIANSAVQTYTSELWKGGIRSGH